MSVGSTRWIRRDLFGRIVLISLLLVSLWGCDKERKRPIGFHRLGKVEEFLESEKVLSEHRLLLRMDQNGLSSMSLMCSYDLETLKSSQDGSYICPLCGSKFDKHGKALAGPASVDLPYYSMLVDAETVGAEKDTLYVRVGDEVPSTWRLKLHFVDR